MKSLYGKEWDKNDKQIIYFYEIISENDIVRVFFPFSRYDGYVNEIFVVVVISKR